MATLHECPKCGEPMEYEECDPSVGIMSSFWFCAPCGVAHLDDDGYAFSRDCCQSRGFEARIGLRMMPNGAGPSSPPSF